MRCKGDGEPFHRKGGKSRDTFFAKGVAGRSSNRSTEAASFSYFLWQDKPFDLTGLIGSIHKIAFTKSYPGKAVVFTVFVIVDTVQAKQSIFIEHPVVSAVDIF